MFRSILTVFTSAFAGFKRDEGVMMAGHLAFLGLMSLFPFFVFLTAAAGLFGDTANVQDAIEIFLDYLPPEVASVLRKPINDVISGAPKGILTVTAVIALWTASSSLDAARIAVRRAFHWAQVQPMLKRRLQSTAIAAVAPLLVLSVMSVQVLGPALWSFLGGDMFATDGIQALWRLLRLMITPVMLFLVLYATYFVFSPYRIRPIAIAPGALVATILWLSTANGLSIYLQNMADYKTTYGGLAGSMVTLLFFFFLGIGFVFGAEVNAAVTEKRKGGNLGTVRRPSAPTPQAPPE